MGGVVYFPGCFGSMAERRGGVWNTLDSHVCMGRKWQGILCVSNDIENSSLLVLCLCVVYYVLWWGNACAWVLEWVHRLQPGEGRSETPTSRTGKVPGAVGISGHIPANSGRFSSLV